MKKEFKSIDKLLRDLKYWKGPNDPRYGYHPTVEPIQFGCDIRKQLSDIGKLAFLYQNHVNTLVREGMSLPSNDHWGSLIKRITKQASGGLTITPTNQTVPICKVDLIFSHNGMQVAEIDAYNPRGIPYAILLSNIYGIDSPVEKVLVDAFDGKKFTWIHANRERYYTNVLHAMCTILLRKHSLTLDVSNCNDITNAPEHTVMVPWGLQAPREVLRIGELEEKSALGKVWFPVAPWLSSKSFLGIVWDQIRKNSCPVELKDLATRYIPETFLVHHRMIDRSFEQKDLVVKPVVSSGHKGVAKAQEDIRPLFTKTPSHILQRFSEPKSCEVEHYLKDGTIATDEFFLRVTAYYDALGNFLDAEVTGRREWLVHGASDCIQCPIVFI